MQKICIIIPCFNEEKRLPIEEFVRFFKAEKIFDVCFVNDGSTDKTINVLTNLKNRLGDKCMVIDNKKNLGKAETVRTGILENINKGYDYIGYFDADLATPLDELNYFLHFCDGSFKYDMIFGSRWRRIGASITRIPSRHYVGRIFSTVVSIMLKLHIYDTQCGAKLISKKYYSIIFEKPFVSKWLFDVELICRAIAGFGYDNVKNSILEIPLNTWIEKGNSRIKPLYYFKAPFDLLKINWKYRKRSALKV